jgi:hypothetical protein
VHFRAGVALKRGPRICSKGTMMCRQQRSLTCLHRDATRVVSVIHAKQVQDAVHDEQRHFVIEGTRVGRRVAIGDHWTDHDITKEQRQFVLDVIGAIRPGPAGIGPPTGRVAITIDWERKNIGGARGPHEATIEIGDGRFVDEHHRKLTLPFNAFVGENRKRQSLPAVEINGHMGLLIGDEHRDLTIGGTMPATPKAAGWFGHESPAAASYAVTMSCTMR